MATDDVNRPCLLGAHPLRRAVENVGELTERVAVCLQFGWEVL